MHIVTRNTEETALLRRIGARVRHARSERRLTMRELAERAHASLRFVAQLEAGEANVAIGRLAAIGGECLAATVALYGLGEPDALPTPALVARAEAWRPWRGYGCLAVSTRA